MEQEIHPSEPRSFLRSCGAPFVAFGKRFVGDWEAWACSAGLHLVLLLLLGTFVLPAVIGRSQSFETIFSLRDDEAGDAELTAIEPLIVPQSDSEDSPPLLQHAPLPLASSKETEPLDDIVPHPQSFGSAASVPGPQSPTTSKLDETPPNRKPPEKTRAIGRVQPLVGDDDGKGLRLSASSNAEGAADQVIGDIKRQLETKDTLVIWLLDGSISMQRELDILASRLEPFVRAAEANKGERMLMHAVLAFGLQTQELVSPTPNSHPVLQAIRNVPVDSSGVENTFLAVEDAVDRYIRRFPKQRQKNIQIVVWTDESGEDLLRLESTIATCKKFNVHVSIVGPSAVLGSARGHHAYVAPENGLLYFLPVTRGPDTALREKPALPYWHRAVPGNWNESERGPWQADLARWYGGSNLEGMLSGFGPYAMIRLTRETGGSYTLFDRPLDRPPFKLEELRPYLPDYRAAKDVAASIQEVPLRRTVISVIEATYGRINLNPPAMNFGSGILGPNEFKGTFGLDLAKEQQKIAAQTVFIEQALAMFGPDGMEEEYRNERLPRWKAWYDLTRGRLLAWSVRLREYEATVRVMSSPRFLGPQTNIVRVVPSRILLSGPETERRAEEAARLLNRCVKQNPNTPWKYLAERELQHALGLEPQQSFLKVQLVPAIGVPSRGPSLPKL